MAEGAQSEDRTIIEFKLGECTASRAREMETTLNGQMIGQCGFFSALPLQAT